MPGHEAACRFVCEAFHAAPKDSLCLPMSIPIYGRAASSNAQDSFKIYCNADEISTEDSKSVPRPEPCLKLIMCILPS